MVFIILGMHKSGTTLLAEMFHKSGINMIEKELEGIAADYYSGRKYERRSTTALNKKILPFRQDHSLGNLQIQQLEVSGKDRQELQDIVADCCRQHVSWGFKDPRTCLTYELWRPYLPEHRVIIIYRHPVSVWRHYYRRNRLNIFRIWRIMQVWSVYNQNLLRIAKDQGDRSILLNYEQMMVDSQEFQRLAEFAGCDLHDARRGGNDQNRSPQSSLVGMVNWLQGLAGLTQPLQVYQELQDLHRQQGAA